MGILLNELFLFFPFADSQQCVENGNQQPKVKRTLNTSNSKVIASFLLLVLVLSAICDVTGESSDLFLINQHQQTLNLTFGKRAKKNPKGKNKNFDDEKDSLTLPKRKNVSDFCLEMFFFSAEKFKFRADGEGKKKFACE
jgi:hypothetical protein